MAIILKFLACGVLGVFAGVILQALAEGGFSGNIENISEISYREAQGKLKDLTWDRSDFNF